MKWVVISIVTGVLIALCTGCRQPVRTYKFTTGSPDVWANQPKQKVEFTVEWTQ